MKRFWLISTAAVFTALFAGSAIALSITDSTSPHNLSTGGPGAVGSDTDRVCVFCHTPHNTRAPGSVPVPLWNRNDGATAATGFTMYDTATAGNRIDMTVAPDPQGVSLVCLGCHDGASAFDNLVNDPGISVTAATMNDVANTTAILGVDLSNDHPISITYDNTDDTDFIALATVDDTLPFFGASNNQLECATCHDVHDNANTPFLRVSTGASALCTTCHTK